MQFLGKVISEVFLGMSQKYKSDIITVQPFPAPPFIILNTYAAIREAMLSPETAEVMSGRPLKVRDSALNPNRCGRIYSVLLIKFTNILVLYYTL